MGACRVIWGCALVAALALFGNSARSVSAAEPSDRGARPTTIVFPTHSSIAIVHVSGHRLIRQHSTEDAYFTCVGFRNTDAREATSVLLHFAFYNAADGRVAEADLTRTGHFSTGVDIDDVPGHGELKIENCVQRPPLRAGVARTIVFVKSVTYADGSVWSTSGPAIPDHLGAPPMPAPALHDPLPSASP